MAWEPLEKACRALVENYCAIGHIFVQNSIRLLLLCVRERQTDEAAHWNKDSRGHGGCTVLYKERSPGGEGPTRAWDSV